MLKRLVLVLGAEALLLSLLAAVPLAVDNSFLLGKVGFMTKSDSLAYFSEAKVSYRPLESLASTLVRDTLAKQPRLKNLRIYGKTTAQP